VGGGDDQGFRGRRVRSRLVVAGAFLAALIFLAGLALGAGGGGAALPPTTQWVRMQVGPALVKAEVVRTPDRLYLGLSYRRQLPPGTGMLFCMPEKQVQVFCMRGMRFPLDFIWIADDRVAGITYNVPPTFPGNLTSPESVNYVLEVPGGFATERGLKVGDRVQWH
jgi:uncharacterized membrane protein (UPF0127 family)